MGSKRLTAKLALLALGALLAGCAHATAPAAPEALGNGTTQPTASGAAGEATGDAKRQKPIRVMVTGSRLPYYVQPGSQVLPTFGPVSVYGREQILSTGREDLGEALRALDPAITTHR